MPSNSSNNYPQGANLVTLIFSFTGVCPYVFDGNTLKDITRMLNHFVY